MATYQERLSPPQQIAIRVVKETPSSEKGFLRLRRLTLQSVYANGEVSREFPYDLVERDAIDAVAILLERTIDGLPCICVRSSLRPPLAFRPSYALPIREEVAAPVQWEVPAGLVERDEHGEEGLRACAARETEEEVGYQIAPSHFALLGPALALSPGVIGEKIFFLHARVDADAKIVPVGDGSVVEDNAESVFISLTEALAAVRDGRISDVKTEIAVRRLAELRAVR